MSSPITLVARNARALVSPCNKQVHIVDSLRDVANVLTGLVTTQPSSARTLDLTGHSRRGTKLLAIGRDTLDLLVPSVERIIERLAESRLLHRLRVEALRVIGCETAMTPAAQRTLKRLERLLRVSVFGTRKAIMSAHYNADGFDSAFDHLLIESSQLPTTAQRLPRVR